MCGIVGIARQKNPVSVEIYESMLMLQHRGQDACGIVTFDGSSFFSRKYKGLVKESFKESDIHYLEGYMGIGHVRYPTAGSSRNSETQPFFVNSPFGIHLVHNGNLTNTDELKNLITKKYHRHLSSNSDSELLLNIFADSLYRAMKYDKITDKKEAVFAAIKKVHQQISGAYSVIMMIDQVGLVAFRDPYGIRPLIYGKKETSRGDEWIIASENVAFTINDYHKIHDIAPGEAIIIDMENELHTKQVIKGENCPCLFEYIYLARPDSLIDDISVYKTQLRLGHYLAKQIKDSGLKIDSVMPVPDSARHAAIEIANILGIKYREGLVKNRYIGRTFIMPNQKIRENSVKQKLNTIPLEFSGQSILIVDDSIVRGTTMKQIIALCRKAGAQKVYVASGAPPIRFPNAYGVDMPTKKEFIANGLSVKEIQKVLGCDALFYQTLEDTIQSAQKGNPHIKKFEASCFDGKYITGITKEYFEALQQSQRSKEKEFEISLF